MVGIERRLADMKSRIYLTIVVAAGLVVAFGLGHRAGYLPGCKRAVTFGRDTADRLAQGSGIAGYEAYFTRDNPIPAHAAGQ